MNSSERYLAKIHQRKYCLLVGNGTTAIYLVLKSQKIENMVVAIPNNVCMNVLLPIYFSNNTPLFVDIEKSTLGIDISGLTGDSCDALIAVHAYGNVCNIQGIQNFCRQNGIFMIEDVAVAQGLSIEDESLGSFGDVSILSFGSGKVIDIGHGGAILTDSDIIYSRLVDELEKLKEYDAFDEEHIDNISKTHTKLYNIDYGKSLNLHYEEFRSLCIKNKVHFLYKFSDSFIDILMNKLSNIKLLLEGRKKNAEYLNRVFGDSGLESLQVIQPEKGSAYWRFNIFVEFFRDELFTFLLQKKYKVSSWYHSIDLLFEPRGRVDTPMSDWIGEHIINIWVNEDIDLEYLENISYDIIMFLKERDK